jgi:hypothetical protein
VESVKETRMYMPVSTGENQDHFGTSVGVGGGPVLLLRWTSLILRPCTDTVASDCEIVVDMIDGSGRK